MRFGDDELWEKREGRHSGDGPSISGVTKEKKENSA
jgi:hypothetical protein